MKKRELIDAILRYNRTAAPEFLAKFSEATLQEYLDRVCAVVTGKSLQQRESGAVLVG